MKYVASMIRIQLDNNDMTFPLFLLYFPSSQVDFTTCDAGQVKDKLKSCDGRDHCSVIISTGQFGVEPCPRIYKYAVVTYECEEREGEGHIRV